MRFDQDLPGCFTADLMFAKHAAERERAFQWLISLRQRHIGWDAARAHIVEFLQSRAASKAHISNQAVHARNLLKPWLLD
jgi:hypothetical protein